MPSTFASLPATARLRKIAVGLLSLLGACSPFQFGGHAPPTCILAAPPVSVPTAEVENTPATNAHGQELLARLAVAQGLRLMDDADDSIGALPWFAHAQRLAPSDPAHAIRLATIVEQYPRLLRVWRSVRQAAFSPDGRQLLLATNNGTAQKWDVETGQPIGDTLAIPSWTERMMFSPSSVDVAFFASTSSDEGLNILLAGTAGPPRPSLSLPGSLTDMVFSADGGRLLAASDRSVNSYNLTTGETSVLMEFKGRHPTGSSWFSADGRLAIVATGQTTALWDTETGQRLRILKTKHTIRMARFSPDGRRVVTNALVAPASVQVWNVADGRELASLGEGDDVQFAQFAPDSQRLLIASDKEVRLWDIESGYAVTPPLVHPGKVTQAAFSPDGRQVAVAAGAFSSDPSGVRVWNTDNSYGRAGYPVTPWLPLGENCSFVIFSPDGRRLLTIADEVALLWDFATAAPHPAGMHPQPLVRISPDSRSLAVADHDRSVGIYDLASGILAAELQSMPDDDQASQPVAHGRFHPSVADFSPDGRRFLLAGQDSIARLWDVASGELLATLDHRDQEGNEPRQIVLATFSPDGHRLVTICSPQYGGSILLRTWDGLTGQPLAAPVSLAETVSRLRFSSDGRRFLIVCGEYGEVQLQVRDTDSGEILSALTHLTSVENAAFSADDRILSVSKGVLSTWDAATGELLGQPAQVEPHGLAEFSPDARRLATCDYGGPARIWDVASGLPLTPLFHHSGWLVRLEFSRDGRFVMALIRGDGHRPNQVRLWDAATGQPATPWLPCGDLGVLSADSHWLVTRADGPYSVRIWNLAAAHIPKHEWATRITVLSGGTIDATGGFMPQRTEARQWELLAIARSGESDGLGDTLAWHQAQADDAERNEQWFALAWHLGAVLDAEPQNVDHWVRRARAWKQFSVWKNAATDYERAVQLSPRDGQLWSNLAEVRAMHFQWSGAVDAWSRAIELNPDNWQLYQGRGRALAELERWDQASADYEKLLAIWPERLFEIPPGVDGYGALDIMQRNQRVKAGVWTEQARLRLAVLDVEGYRRACVELLTRYGGGYQSRLVIATCVLSPGAVSDPAPLVELAVASVNDIGGPDLLGAALYRSGRLDEALPLLVEALDTEPLDPATWLFRALAEQGLGRTAAAGASLAEATRLFNDLPAAGQPGAPTWQLRLEYNTLRGEAEQAQKRTAP